MRLQIKIASSLVLFLYCSFSFTQGVWTQKADLPGSVRSAAIGFSFNDCGFIGFGSDGTTGPHNDLWRYDPATNAWTQKSAFGGLNLITNAVAFSIGNKGYVGTAIGINKKEFWEYDTTSNTWMQKADFGGPGRWSAVGFSIGSKGYISTGYESSNGHFKDFWEYGPTTNVWAQRADFGGAARSAAIGFSIGNKGYVGTGGDGTPYKKDFWEWDEATDTWSQKADFGGTARYGAVGFSIGNKGYIGTGRDTVIVGYLYDFWEYDPTLNSWAQKADFGGVGRADAVGFSIGNKGYIGTGFAAQVMERKDFWEYDPNGIGIEEVKNSNQIKVFPNPFHERTNISIDSKINFPFDVVLISIAGEKVQRISNLHSNSFQLSREKLPSGIYFLKISNHKKESFTKKLIID